ncbi:hypothetical protein [Adhaeribacter pallidiroseus]|uniref:Uncharacterized protein n=1 Tax=Adhaeribacter pallidiroseus TaxID=2072847 RepID=A0A369QUZ7_9BACT|nr:hypothetical protein [Adhaeribacter pallidiroseus]RDC66008.1 hypothetical protein AHMF7616_04639 [Adhaeribacter pallidiroseus]
MSFFKSLVLVSVLLGLVAGILIYTQGYNLIHPYFWYMLLFFVFVTAFTYYIIALGSKNDPGNFQMYYFGSTAFRVLMCMGVIFIYIYFAADRKLQFTLNFFLLYFIYTGFEIYHILTNLRQNSKKQL